MSMLPADGEHEQLSAVSLNGCTHPSKPYFCMAANRVRAKSWRLAAVLTCVEKYWLPVYPPMVNEVCKSRISPSWPLWEAHAVR